MSTEETRSRIVIEGEMARYERLVTRNGQPGRPPEERVMETKQVSLDALFAEAGEMFLLPANCRFARREREKTVFVIEEAPRVRTVSWNTSHSKYDEMRARLARSGLHRLFDLSFEEWRQRISSQRQFQLAFPYLVRCYLFLGQSFVRVTFWYRRQPLGSERDGLLVPNLPNRFTDDGHICLPSEFLDPPGSSFAQKIQAIEDAFWASPWNHELTENFFQYAARVSELASPWEWEYHSRVDPTFVAKIPWKEAERSLLDEVEYLLDIRVKNTRYDFTALLNRLRSADPWDGVSRAEEATVEPSPAESLIVGGAVVSIGDEIKSLFVRFPGFSLGQSRAIEWFGKPSRLDGSRLIKLAGIAQPLTLIVGKALVSGLELVKKELPEADLKVGEITLKPGSWIRFNVQAHWPDWYLAYYRLIRVKRNRRGAILARFEGNDISVVIGEDDSLFPGLAVFPAEEVDGRFLLASEAQLLDGRRLRRGDRFLLTSYPPVTIELKRFLALCSGDRFRRFEDTRGDPHDYEEMDGGLSAKLIPLPDQKIKSLKAGRRIIRLGDLVEIDGVVGSVEEFSPFLPSGRRQMACLAGKSEWMKFLVNEDFETGVRVLPPVVVRPTRFSFGGEYLEAGGNWWDAHWRCVRRLWRFEARGNRVMAAFDGGWELFFESGQRVSRFEPVLTVWRRPGFTTIFRGLRLRLCEKIPGFTAGAKFIVSHLIPPSGRKPAVVVTSKGLGFSLTVTNAWLFEARLRNQWQPLTRKKATLEAAPHWLEKPGQGLAPGVVARYLGGDPHVNFRRHEAGESLAKETLIEIVESTRDGKDWLCRFANKIPGTHNASGRFVEARYQWIYSEYLTVVLSTIESGLLRIFQNFRRNSRLIDPGKEVGLDCHGRT
ncbi:hypothetical protein HY628_00615 [Candidatus Uhrbacteria bacterium]|nr:hypothetical protein [Candidatus Uhrbacteria bacterium]